VNSKQTWFRDKVVLITGASSGIGEELALQLGAAGARLALTARRRDLLENLAQKISAQGGTPPLAIECDVTREGDLERAVTACVQRWGRFDVAIANAGFGVTGALNQIALDDYRRQFETNVFGVLRTIYAALPELEKTKGRIAIVGSVSGWVASPLSSAYSMSKFAVRALANSITPELERTGVKVTLISPGFVDSNIRRVDNQGKLHSKARDSAPPWLVMNTGKAARQMLRAIAAGKREVIITGHGKILVAVERFMPWILRAAAKRLAAGRSNNRSEAKGS
jgi:short-subunit dehydrogenase